VTDPEKPPAVLVTKALVALLMIGAVPEHPPPHDVEVAGQLAVQEAMTTFDTDLVM
jgi:hypothetical protein